MSYSALIHRLTAVIGPDALVSLDDDVRPTQLRFYRQDRITEDLIRDAIAKVSGEFPDEMRPIVDVFVAFEDHLGATRRRVAL